MTFQGVPSWKTILNKLVLHQNIDEPEARWAMQQIMSGATSEAVIASFLTALQSKGASAGEISSLASEMISYATDIEPFPEALDIVGTGGDMHNTINISTMSSIVIAGAGYTVVKHGNRASSSTSGSADVLEELGVNLNLKVKDLQHAIKSVGIGFLFAQNFHPSMRFVAPVRKQMGIPTVFNYLGPLANPAKVNYSAIGVANYDLASKVAEVFAHRKNTRTLVLRGRDGMDEISIATLSDIWVAENGGVTQHEFDPQEFGFKFSDLSAIEGKNASYNASVARDVFSGAKGAARDAILLNSAAGIFAVESNLLGNNFEEQFSQALKIAKNSLDSGLAAKKLEEWIAVSNSY